MTKISVLLPVKNGAKYIKECIESILRQSWTDFELLVMDDDSSDDTVDIIKRISDDRISLYPGKDGFIANLNMGIQLAQGEFIARMDADDLMHPWRLEIQYLHMKNSSIDLCATWMNIFGEGVQPYILGDLAGIIHRPLYGLRHYNFISHPTVMLRTQFLLRHNLQYQHYNHVEDYKLWAEMAKREAIFYIIPMPLLDYRISENQITANNQEEIGLQSIVVQNEIESYLATIRVN